MNLDEYSPAESEKVVLRAQQVDTSHATAMHRVLCVQFLKARSIDIHDEITGDPARHLSTFLNLDTDELVETDWTEMMHRNFPDDGYRAVDLSKTELAEIELYRKFITQRGEVRERLSSALMKHARENAAELSKGLDVSADEREQLALTLVRRLIGEGVFTALNAMKRIPTMQPLAIEGFNGVSAEQAAKIDIEMTMVPQHTYEFAKVLDAADVYNQYFVVGDVQMNGAEVGSLVAISPGTVASPTPKQSRRKSKSPSWSTATGTGQVESGTIRNVMGRVGRNDPCPCGACNENGSPIKYKKCCGLWGQNSASN